MRCLGQASEERGGKLESNPTGDVKGGQVPAVAVAPILDPSVLPQGWR